VRIKELRSLVWLYRWYGGRAQRLDDLHRSHLAILQQLVLDELGGIPDEPVELYLCGFAVLVTATQEGLSVLSITPPTFATGAQLDLFELDAGELAELSQILEVQLEAVNA
jgi:hypothetical protein